MLQLLPSSLKVLWLHKENTTNYFYLDDSTAIIHQDTVICNGVEMEPLYGTRLLWHLRTPLPYIQAMNSDNIPPLLPPLTTTTLLKQKQAFDITGLAFSSVEDFTSFMYEYKEL